RLRLAVPRPAAPDRRVRVARHRSGLPSERGTPGGGNLVVADVRRTDTNSHRARLRRAQASIFREWMTENAMIPTSIVTTQRRARSPQRHERSALGGPTEAEFTPWLSLTASEQTLSLAVKRGLDYLFATLFLILSLPVFLIISAAIKWTSPGPVFFIQERVGQDGKRFPFYKFRTMKHNSDDAVHREFSRDFIRGSKKDGSPPPAKVYKLTRDPRVTAIGQF